MLIAQRASTLVIVLVFLSFSIGCASAPPTPVPLPPPTLAPLPTAAPPVPTTAAVPTVAPSPASTSAPSPAATAAGPANTRPPSPTPGPVSFVWQITAVPEELNSPTGLAVDKQGNLYLFDAGLGKVFKYNPDGKLLTQWGGRGTADGQFGLPTLPRYFGITLGNLALDGQGNLYVPDVGNARVQKFDANGKFLAAIGKPGDGLFTTPFALSVDSKGFLYVIEGWEQVIFKFDPSGKLVTKFGETGSGDGQFTEAIAMSIDSQDNLYVADKSLGRVQKFSPDGKFLSKWEKCGSNTILQAAAVAVDRDGNLYIADQGPSRNTNPSLANLGHVICKYDRQGQFLYALGGKGSGDGQLLQPSAVTVDDAGNIYVAETGNKRIDKFRQASPASALPTSFLNIISPTPSLVRPTSTPAPTYTPVANSSAPQLVGTWAYTVTVRTGPQRRELTLRPDGTFVVTYNETLPDTGVYQVKGNQFLIADNKTQKDSCAPSDDPGVYEWIIEKDVLTLEGVKEFCSGRKVILSDHWIRQGAASGMPPQGIYTMTLTANDVPANNGKLKGSWELRFLEGNRFTITREGGSAPYQEGTLNVSPEGLVFPVATGEYGCSAFIPGTGTYKWAFDGKALTFTTVQDQCGTRENTLTRHPWIRLQ